MRCGLQGCAVWTALPGQLASASTTPFGQTHQTTPCTPFTPLSPPIVPPPQGIALVSLALSRAASSFPFLVLVNWLRLPQYRMPFKSMFLLWWSGLRGAMAFALSVEAAQEFGFPGRVRARVRGHVCVPVREGRGSLAGCVQGVCVSA